MISIEIQKIYIPKIKVDQLSSFSIFKPNWISKLFSIEKYPSKVILQMMQLLI